MNTATLKIIMLYIPLLETLNEVNGTSLGGIPEGHAFMIYNSLLTLDQFKSMLQGLINQRVIIVKGYLITQGPEFQKYLEAIKPVAEKMKGFK